MGIRSSSPGAPPSLQLYTNVSWTGWRVHFQGLTAAGKWASIEKDLHTNILEMKAIELTLNALLPRIMGESVVPMSNSVTVWWFISRNNEVVLVDISMLT